MGILANTCSIMLGGILGSMFKTRILLKNSNILGISVMIISFVGIIENIFDITEKGLESVDLILVIFALIVGSILGDVLKIEERMNIPLKSEKTYFNAVITASMFFGIGGLQICGPILMATNHDSSQLFLKSMIDFPFALVFGATYGRAVSFSCIPVAVVQIFIAVIAYLAGPFMNGRMIDQLCAMGYIILFFAGFNLICGEKYKVNTIHMIPAIIMVIVFNLIANVWRMLV